MQKNTLLDRVAERLLVKGGNFNLVTDLKT